MTEAESPEQFEWPPKLTIDVSKILELLTGDRFYSNKDASLREAILNAIDACTRRKALDESVRPAIQVVFDDSALTVTVADNGDGMTRADVVQLFARIGASVSQLSTNVELVGEFGIGVVSYFLVCDQFDVHTRRVGQDAIGLVFSNAMRDASTPARETAPNRNDPGTTLTLHIRTQELYDLLVDRFKYWCRGVEGLSAVRKPSGTPLSQGLSNEPAATVTIDLPNWAESARLGPPIGFDRWAVLDGLATVDILYRGVYVQTETIQGLWGMEGTISVHPKSLKPRLNREAFVAEDLQRDVVPFLQTVHPAVLHSGLVTLVDALDDPAAENWSITHLVTLWLAVPRTALYEHVVKEWDDLFRSKNLFRHLADEGEHDISLNLIEELSAPIYLAPDNLANATDIVRAAVRVLRGQGATVVQGVARNAGFLSQASLVAQSSSELLLNYFQSEILNVVRIENIAEKLVSETVRVAALFLADPKVALVRLGHDSVSLVRALGELWINIDTPAGRSMVQSVCAENRGRRSLLIACHEHDPGQVAILSGFLQTTSTDDDHLGLVTREHLRGLVQ